MNTRVTGQTKRKGKEINPSSTKSIFKPLIASSLALALGVSVASATNTTINVNSTSVDGLKWIDSGGYKSFSLSSDNSNSLENIQIEISETSGVNNRFRDRSGDSFTRADLDFANGTTQAILNGNGNGLKIGANGTGTLYISLWNSTNTNKTLNLDLSNATQYALWGSLYIKKTGGAGRTTFEGIFGGQGINGNVTFDASGSSSNTGLGTANVILKNNATITGNVSVLNNGTYSLAFEKTGGGSIGGSMRFANGSATTTIKNLSSVAGDINLQSGSHKIIFQDSSGATTSVPTLTANINLNGGTTTISGLSQLSGNITTYNKSGQITFNTTSPIIAGNIVTSASGGYSSSATLIFSNGATFKDGTIETKGDGWGNAINRFDLGNTTHFENTKIHSVSNTIWGTSYNRGNIFKINGQVYGKITELNSIVNKAESDNGLSYRAKNILSFDGSTHSTLTIDYINKSSTIGSNLSAYNYIGKNITAGSGDSLDLNSALFATNGGWNSNEHQANITLTVTGGILTSNGANYINVKGLDLTGEISASGSGINNIIAESGNFNVKGISTKGYSRSSAGNMLDFGNATLTIEARSGDSDSNLNGKAIYAWNGNNSNIISAQTINVNGDIVLGGGAVSNTISGQIISIAGNITGNANHFFLTADNSTLTLKGSSNTIATLTAFDSATNGNTLILDASSKDSVVANINTLNNGDKLKIEFKGIDSNKTTHLTLNTPSATTLKSVKVTSGTNNTLTLNGSGETTITDSVIIDNSQGITFGLNGGADLTFNNGLTLAGNGNASFNLNGDSSIKGNTSLLASGTLTFNFEGNNSMLTLKDSSGTTQNLSTSLNTTNINFNQSGTIAGSVSTTYRGTTNINIDNNAYAIIDGTLTTENISRVINTGTTPNTNVTLNSGTLVIKGAKNNISNLILGDGNATLSLTDFNGSEEDNRGRRNIVIDTLTTGLTTGTLTLATQASASSADTFTITRTNGNNQGTYRFGISLDGGVNLNEVGAHNAILVASVTNNNAGIIFENTAKVVGDIIEGVIEIDSRENGGNTDYYLGKILNANIILAEQAVTATAFTLNYDLYMANFNSLNKRMGELRENAHSQGVWARVFNGAQTNTQGLGSKSNYTTIQAGYDYAFGFEGANNYLGVALSYALSTSKANNTFDSNGHTRSIDNIYSNAVEVAVYNSYVSDMGWYNDSIAKFSYLMSSFDVVRPSETTSNNTTNFAFTLGDEVGYKFALGEDKEWGITPQLEAVFGYFNQSDFKQTLQSQSTINSMADSILTLRTRVGSTFSYDIRKISKNNSFNASVYVGAFYEYDYVEGGNVTMDTNAGIQSNELSDISSDGRVVMNVGTNMSIKDNTRIYFDFEKSFAGKITTDYQVNVGVRYSFGESNGYTPKVEKAEFKAPLKVEGEESKEENAESKEAIEGEESAKENTLNSQEQNNPTENKAQ